MFRTVIPEEQIISQKSIEVINKMPRSDDNLIDATNPISTTAKQEKAKVKLC
jgi:hypothetical protein